MPSKTDAGRRSKREVKRAANPVLRLLLARLAHGVSTMFIVSVLVFLATQVLAGNAAYAIVGSEASAETLKAVEAELNLDQGILTQYSQWIGGLLSGNPGTSLVNGLPVWEFIYPRLINSGVLISVAGSIGAILAMSLGMLAAARRDGIFDHTFSVLTLVVTALPDFVIAISFILVFSTVVFDFLPGTSALPPGVYPWDEPTLLILPVATMVVVVIPYIFRSMRATMIEALESEYVEMARLKGLSPVRVAVAHALPNAIAPTIQVVGVTFLYLAGGLVLVEYVFAYPGLGSSLVDSVNTRDIPVIQFIVVVLAAFYVLMNITTDVIALLVTPRRLEPT